jgi:hypothetical protein
MNRLPYYVLALLVILLGEVWIMGHQQRTTYMPQSLLAPIAWEAPIFADGFDSACWLPGRTWVKKASISYGVYPAQRLNLDVTQWDNLWGYNNTTAPRVSWPGVGGASPVNIEMPANGFLCTAFVYRAPYSGKFSNPSFVNGPNVSQDIVAHNGLMPTPGCIARDVPTSDANLVQWKGATNNPTGSCNLVNGTTYYVRQWFTRPADCAKPNCVIGSVSYHN